MKVLILIMMMININIIASTTDKLTLEYALEQAKKFDFDAKKQQLNIINNKLIYDYLDIYKLQINIASQLGIREEYNKTLDDSKFYLQFSKKLFDKTNNIKTLAQKNNIDIENMRLNNIVLGQKILMMRAFFMTIIADLEYQYLTEKLALSAVTQNHAIQDFDIGYVSEVEVLEAKYKTQEDFNKRLIIENKQILSRNKLANLLHLKYPNRPDELVQPNLNKYFNYELEDVNYWHKIVFKNNPILKILNSSIANLITEKKSYIDNNQLSISSSLNLGGQSYNSAKNGNYNFAITANIPIFDDKKDKDIMAINIKITQEQLKLEEYRDELNNNILALYLALKQLKHKKKTLAIKQEYLDFYLEKSSLEYEMRITRNIGNAMVLWTKNELDMAKIDFAIAISLEKMNLLTAGIIL